jgi:hypothetical protein
MPKREPEVGVSDGVFVPAGGGGGATQQRRPSAGLPSRAARREAEKEEAERAKKEKKKRESKRGSKDEEKEKEGGIRILPTIFMIIMFGPAIFPIVMAGADFLGNTSVGLAIFDGCVDVGVCTTYHDQLKAIYEENNPKKVKGIGKLLKKWKGKEAQLIKEVEGKYEQKRKYEQIRKAAMERDKKDREGTRDEDRGKRSKKKSASDSSNKDAPPPPKASGWDDGDATADEPVELWDDEDEVDLADLMGGDDMMR